MAILHEITDGNELKKYLEKFRTEPKYRPFFHSLKFRLDGLFPKQPFQLFVQNEYMTNYFYGLTTCKYETRDTRPASVIVEHEGPFDDTEFLKGMEALLKKSSQKLGWVIGNYHSCLLAERYIENSMPRIYTKAYLCKRYYMDEEQMRDLMNWKCPALQNGYELGIL
ncbi:hypothetical protein WR25_00094 [Diploscapter pachys]|uniref:Uncharacterized protein n=1 Tax=Diploscapter pachys TaxID=2018661 RepID=A0A2A2KEJ9_9BILA|nr:hypothetical protein WR25_00094 [Diploscapter pachys]